MLEYYLVITDQHDPKRFVDPGLYWEGQRVWWGPGAERKASKAAYKLNGSNMPFNLKARVESVFTA